MLRARRRRCSHERFLTVASLFAYRWPMPDTDCLIVSGGWEGHRPRECADVFIPLLESAGLRVRHADALSALDDGEALKRLKLIVPNWTMGTLTGEQESNLCDAVAAGVGLGGWHGGMGDAFRSNTTYQFMVGGQFVAHPGNIIDYTVRVSDRDHPVTRGLAAVEFNVRSEQYYMHVDPSNHVLAVTWVSGDVHPWLAGTMMPAAWVRPWGEGRVFYCSVGHAPEDLADPPVKELVRRGLLWAARLLEE